MPPGEVLRFAVRRLWTEAGASPRRARRLPQGAW
jgi:hypothetical protein